LAEKTTAIIMTAVESRYFLRINGHPRHGNAKDVQTHLRHTDIATTLDVYTQPIDANVRRLVNAVTTDVMTSKPERVQ
jgi:hypothetical protein